MWESVIPGPTRQHRRWLEEPITVSRHADSRHSARVEKFKATKEPYVQDRLYTPNVKLTGSETVANALQWSENNWIIYRAAIPEDSLPRPVDHHASTHEGHCCELQWTFVAAGTPNLDEEVDRILEKCAVNG